MGAGLGRRERGIDRQSPQDGAAGHHSNSEELPIPVPACCRDVGNGNAEKALPELMAINLIMINLVLFAFASTIIWRALQRPKIQ